MARPMLAVNALALILAGCASDSTQRNRATEARQPPNNVRVEMKNPEGAIVGSAALESGSGGVRIHGRVNNLPAGEHGVHFHQNGACDLPDFKSAGDHLNPGGTQHGDKNPNGPHLGDLGNITVNSDGSGEFDLLAKSATLQPGINSLLKPGGTALMIHANADDQKTDPSGNSGDRIACGVVPGR
jgi:superoxide dismutase, Cu-Zn family